MFPRPTLRCIREDFAKELPRLGYANYNEFLKDNVSLDKLDIPLLVKASRPDIRTNSSAAQKIQGIKDNLFYEVKVKSPSVRAALWLKEETEESWLVAAGPHRAGSSNDFYVKLVSQCEQRAKSEKATNPSYSKKTYSKHLLPQKIDYTRLDADQRLDDWNTLKKSIAFQLKAALPFLQGSIPSPPVRTTIEAEGIKGHAKYTVEESNIWLRIDLEVIFEKTINPYELQEIMSLLSGLSMEEWDYEQTPTPSSIAMFAYLSMEDFIKLVEF